MSDERRAVLLLVLTAVLWSLAGVLIKSVEWGAPAIASARSLIAALVLLPLVRARNFTWSGAQIGAAAAYALTVTLFVAANKLTTAANAILLQYTAPFWIAVFAPWYLGERAGRPDWPIMAAILAGIALFFFDDLTIGGCVGNALALASGMSFGWLALFLRRQKRTAPFESVFLGNVLAALVGLPFVPGSWPTVHGSIGLGLLLTGVLGVFPLGLSYVCYAKAIRLVTALEAILILSIEPILNPCLVFLLIGERPGPRALLGGVLVVGAVTARGILTAGRKNARAVSPRSRAPSG